MTTKRGVWRKSQVGCGDLLSIRKPSTVILVSPAWIYFICPRPTLPQIHTTPQLFQSMLYILTHFWGVGRSVSLRFTSFFMNRKNTRYHPLIFRDQPQPVRRLVTQDCSVRRCLSWWISPPRWSWTCGGWSLSFKSRLQGWSCSRLVTWWPWKWWIRGLWLTWSPHFFSQCCSILGPNIF